MKIFICPMGFCYLDNESNTIIDYNGDTYNIDPDTLEDISVDVLNMYAELDLQDYFWDIDIEQALNNNNININLFNYVNNRVYVNYSFRNNVNYFSFGITDIRSGYHRNKTEKTAFIKAVFELSNQAILMKSRLKDTDVMQNYDRLHRLMSEIKPIFYRRDESSLLDFAAKLKEIDDFSAVEPFLAERLISNNVNSIQSIKMIFIIGYKKFADEAKQYLWRINRSTYKYQIFERIVHNDFTNYQISYYVNFINENYKECVLDYYNIREYYNRYEILFGCAVNRLSTIELIECIESIDRYEFSKSPECLLKNINDDSLKVIFDYLIDNNYRFNTNFSQLYKNNLLDYKYINRISYYQSDFDIIKEFIKNIKTADYHDLFYFIVLLSKTSFKSVSLINKVVDKFDLNNSHYAFIYKNMMVYHFNDNRKSYIRFNEIERPVVDFQELFNKFKPIITCETYNDDFRIDLEVYYYNTMVLRFYIDNEGIYIKDDILDYSSSSLVLQNYYCYLMDNNVDGIADTLKEKQILLNNRLEEARINNLKSLMKNFTTKHDLNALTNIKQDSIDLQIIIDCFSDEEDDTFILKFKVGRNKYYIVKSLDDLYNRILLNKTYKYGKDLEFTHNFNVFNETSRKVLEYLLPNHLYDGRNNIMVIKPNVFFELLKMYKGRNIYIQNELYYVNLEQYNVEFNIDENFTFKLSDDINSKYYRINDNICLKVNENTKTIDYLYEEDPTLLPLGITLNNMDLKAVKDDFYSDVYSRIPEYITLDDNIKGDFKQTDLKIKLYFDYQNYIISVKKEYYINDLLTPYEDVDYISKQKIDRVNKLLSQIGFVDDVIKDTKYVSDFFVLDFSELRKNALVYLSDRINKLNIQRFIKPNISFKNRDNSMVSVFLDDIKYSEEELAEIFVALKNKTKYIELKNDTILTFDEGDFNFYDDCNELDLKYDNEIYTPLYNIIKYQFNNKTKFDQYLKELLYDIKNFRDLDYQLPKIEAKLRDYQIDGFKWLKTLEKYSFGGILADEMGLGKTLQVIALLASIKPNKPNLIVCPKSLIYNWLNEFKKFAPNLNVCAIVGNKDERTAIINNISDSTNYIASYETVRNDDFSELDFNYLILDEAQVIKNHTALKSKEIRNIKANNRLCLTGTPVENSTDDIWSIFLFLMPGFFKGIKDFRSEYENNISELNKKISPFILRRTKKEVLTDLPDKYEEIISTEITSDERKIYELLRLEAKAQLGEPGGLFSIFKYITRLRQTCVSPSLFVDNYKGVNSKLETLYELLREAKSNGNKVLVFSQFVSVFELIEPKLKDLNINYNKITGKTSSLDRINIANEFNASSNIDLLLISLKAGGTGLNLTSADTVIHLDPWWNVAVENQATDRAHRIGQTKNVRVIKLICEDTIEQRVIMLQNEKKKLFDSLVDNNEDALSKLNEEDMKYILS